MNILSFPCECSLLKSSNQNRKEHVHPAKLPEALSVLSIKDTKSNPAAALGLLLN